MLKLLLATLLLASHQAEAFNILVVCPFFGKSHSTFIHPIVTSLGYRDHNITIITTNLIKDAPDNIRQIQPYTKNADFNVDPAEFFKWDAIPSYVSMFFIWEMTLQKTRDYIESSEVQDFLKEDNQFDVVVIEAFFHEAYYGFAHKFNAPIVILGTATYFHQIGDAMGNPHVASYLSFEFSRHAGELDILQRTNNYLLYLYSTSLYKIVYYPRQQRILAENFGSSAPSIRELEKNISLALFNTHYSIDEVRPLIPGIVEVGGVHLKKPKQLPGEIEDFIEKAPDGVIYFSLGSSLRSASMPKDKLDAIIKTFGKLKQKVIWKWEDDVKPDMPDNIMTSKWLPQSDILAHPNIKIFITHCGMLSTQEVTHRGVPIIGIPVYGDQHLNMAKIELTGMGFQVSYTHLTEETLTNAINKILNDPKYAATAKEMSERFGDRQNHPLDTAVYWVEYVTRYKGANFMKSKLANTSWFQRNLIDVYVAIFLIVYISVYLITQFFKILFRICPKKNKNVENKKKKD